MKMITTQRMLRAKVRGRLIILISAIFILLITFCCDNYFSADIDGFLLGISASALVWAIVELYDFYVETLQTYIDQRDDLLGLLVKHFSALRKFSNVQKYSLLNTEAIAEEISDLTTDVYNYPFVGKIYAMSKEFYDISNYVKRLNWKMVALRHLYALKPDKTDEFKQEVFKMLVEESYEQNDVNVALKELCTSNQKYEAIADIDICFSPYPTPDIVSYETKGDLGKKITIFGDNAGQTLYKTLIPRKDFEQIFSAKVRWYIVINLLCRTIEKEEK